MKRIIAMLLLAALLASACGALADDREVWGYQGKVAFFGQDGKIGLLHKSGKRTIIAAIFEEVRPFADGLANVKQGGLWGLINQDGRWVFRVASLSPIAFGPDGDYGLYSPEAGKYGFIDREGNIVLEPMAFADAGVMAEGLFAAADGRGYGYVNAAGQTVIAHQYEAARPFSQGLAAVKKDGKWGYIDLTGETVLPFAYEEAGSFARDLAAVKPVGEAFYCYIDGTGAAVLTGEWEFAGDFTGDKLARVRVNGLYGFINQKGKLTIPARYEEAGDFGNTFAPVRTGQGWVYLSTKGKIISKAYLAAEPYADGCALVTWQPEGDGAEPVTGYITTKRIFVCHRMP